MGVYSSLTQRPPNFELNPYSPLATGLVFAGLGRITGSTHYRDSSPCGNHGTLTLMDAATDWGWGNNIGRWCVNLDGSNDYIVATIPWKGGPTTIASWCRPTGFVQYGRLVEIGANDGIALVFDATGKVQIQWGSTPVITSPSSIVDSNWHCVVGHSGPNAAGGASGNYNLWVDGVVGTPVSQNPPAAKTALNIGRYGGGGYVFTGDISDLLIYDRILSNAEIYAISDPSNVMLSGLVLPPRRRLWAVSGGAAPAVTAKGRAFLAGGGVYRFPRRTVRTGG